MCTHACHAGNASDGNVCSVNCTTLRISSQFSLRSHATVRTQTHCVDGTWLKASIPGHSEASTAKFTQNDEEASIDFAAVQLPTSILARSRIPHSWRVLTLSVARRLRRGSTPRGQQSSGGSPAHCIVRLVCRSPTCCAEVPCFRRVVREGMRETNLILRRVRLKMPGKRVYRSGGVQGRMDLPLPREGSLGVVWSKVWSSTITAERCG